MLCLGNSVCLNLICHSDGGGITLGLGMVVAIFNNFLKSIQFSVI